MTSGQTDHDLLITVANDVGYVRDNISELRKLIGSHIEAVARQRKDDDQRFRALEQSQKELQTRWQVFGWVVGVLSALSALMTLIQYLGRI